MEKIETLGILDEIEALVSVHLQVVSYKWLSRNFLVSSNEAKELLQDFVEKHGGGLEVVYALSGWCRSGPPSYHINLVSGCKLEEAKQEFDENCSIHVYSVQASIPKDPATLWHAEFVQAEQLFKQPFAVDNCLRDNRFCGISNFSVKRNVIGAPASLALPKSIGVPGPSKSFSAHQNTAVQPPQEIKFQQSKPNICLQSSNVVKDLKTESNHTKVHYQAAKDPDKENKNKVQIEKSSSANGSSLANLWGRASAKAKTAGASADNNLITNPSASGEAQISACEALEDGSSDDEAQDVNFKRASSGEGSRKRRVVLDFSDDEYEDAVNLSSPDLPKGHDGKTLLSEKSNFNKQTEDKPKVKEEKLTEVNQRSSKDSSATSKGTDSKMLSSENIHSHITGNDVKETAVSKVVSNSPTRRKVLKTWIDEQGREVTEVVREGKETEMKKVDDTTIKKSENDAVACTINNRAPAAKKSPAVGNTAPSNPGGKAGNKKGVNKDAKQGNILSFFKRV